MEILQTLGINPEVILANIISFLLLYWLLSKFLFPPVRQIMRERKEGIEANYADISEKMALAEQRHAELDQRLTQIEIEARSRIEEAGVQAARLKDEILADARVDAEKVRERALADIEREHAKAIQSIREHVADLVVQTTEKVLGESLNEPRHRDLIARTIDQIGNSRN